MALHRIFINDNYNHKAATGWLGLTPAPINNTFLLRTAIITACLVLTAGAQPAHAQTNIDSLRKANKDIKIATSALLGKWYGADSLVSEITFVEQGACVIMEPWLVGVSNYTFIITNDSVAVHGWAPNWPPYYCLLHLIDQYTLEVIFY